LFVGPVFVPIEGLTGTWASAHTTRSSVEKKQSVGSTATQATTSQEKVDGKEEGKMEYREKDTEGGVRWKREIGVKREKRNK